MRTILVTVIAVCAAAGVLTLVVIVGRMRLRADEAMTSPPPATQGTPRPSPDPGAGPTSRGASGARRAAIVLPASAAQVHGAVLKLHAGGPSAEQEIAYWTDPKGYVEWPVDCPAAGKYAVELTYACAPGSGGSYFVSVGRDKLSGHSDSTGGSKVYKVVKLGTVSLQQEQTTLSIKPNGIQNTLMNVRRVRLVPVP